MSNQVFMVHLMVSCNECPYHIVTEDGRRCYNVGDQGCTCQKERRADHRSIHPYEIKANDLSIPSWCPISK